MTKNFLTTLLVFTALAINAQDIWNKVDEKNITLSRGLERTIIPTAYETFSLSMAALESELASAGELGTDGKPVYLDLPMPDGSLETFEVFEAPVMEPGLEAKFPNIKSYKGISVKNRTKNVRFDLGSYGFHAAVHSLEGIFYIDPYATGNDKYYQVYDVARHMETYDVAVPFCGVDDSDHKADPINPKPTMRSSAENIPLRVYRIAIACTGEWGRLRGNANNAISAMNTGINRINQIYENELAMRLVLIEENDLLLNFDKDTDPYPNTSSGSAMLSINTGVINDRLGVGANDKYDLGHVYNGSCDVGGVARLNSMCNDPSKGGAVTCFYRNDLDYMASLVTSHEIGHQFSALHTFNNCNGNESLSNGYEPGSGSTIMSYGGLCGGALNVVSTGEDYYHNASLIHAYNHTRNGGTADGCSQKIETSNIEPEIQLDYPENFSIPANTPFFLDGSATDANPDDVLTYVWEQKNAASVSVPLGSPITGGPHFRSFRPTTNTTRYFPSVDNILQGTFDRTEVLPASNMELSFAFTVRDNNIEAGTAVWEEIDFDVVNTGEAFAVISQSNLESFTMGDEISVEWNVAGTDNRDHINCQFVDILFSDKQWNEFDIYTATVLAARVPNTGSAVVNIPAVQTNTGRIIVKAHDNIFFNTNSTNVQVLEPTVPTLFAEMAPLYQNACLPALPTATINTAGLGGLSGDVRFEVANNLPANLSVTFSPEMVQAGESSTASFTFADASVSGEIDIEVLVIAEGQDTFSKTLTLKVSDNDHSSVLAEGPANGESGVSLGPDFTWSASTNADTYTFQLGTSPAFTSESILYEENEISATSLSPAVLLEKSNIYYWRILGENTCGITPTGKTFAFATEALSCETFEAENLPVNITQSGTPTVYADVRALVEGQVADINIPVFAGTHRNTKDLTVNLISPAGTSVRLFSNICPQSDFNVKFDDDANLSVRCPLNRGDAYRPKGMLSDFNGESVTGVWQLEIQDNDSGDGGALEAFELEICSNQVLEGPEVVVNEKLEMAPGSSPKIRPTKLKVEDANNSDDELIYTLVSAPTLGTLELLGEEIGVGAQFTQEDLNRDRLEYITVNDPAIVGDDYFEFTVIDGEGGWVEITRFEMEIGEGLVSSTNTTDLADQVGVYPNPAQNRITISIGSELEVLGYSISNMAGQVILKSSAPINGKTNVNVAELATGLYLVEMETSNGNITKKLIITK